MSIGKQDLRIWIINLPSATTRRSNMTARLDRLGLDYEIFDAIDGHKRFEEFRPQVDTKRYERDMGQRLLPGKVGCYFSHLSVWNVLAASNAKVGLILEDDVVFHDDFIVALDTALAGADHWDLLRLNSTRARFPIAQGSLGNYRLNAYLGRSTGNGCYLVHRDVAKRLLPRLENMKLAFEYEIGQFFEHKYNFLGLEPFPSHIDDGGLSQITGRNNQYLSKITNWRRIGHFVFKASNYANRFLFLLRNKSLLGHSEQLMPQVRH
ncbi:glycosyltransferase family 25 protein [Yoonia algicola]|uniref:Glycosyltransferase family 25 protein n=1 Tax=Yoonia algicola TaxID=3137368 RepID=A0AAN0M540_9RHOB